MRYELEQVNMVNGKKKRKVVYDSSARLKVDHIYFHLPGMEVGAYRVVKELGQEDAKQGNTT